jgi:hypothetical protein
MQEVLIILGLAFFTACGVCLTTAACFNGQSIVPLCSTLMGFMALTTACSCDLLHDAGSDMPAALMDYDSGGGGGAASRSDVGWLLCGIFITAAWSLPLVLARHGVLTMRVSWLSSLGTWSLVGTLGLGLLLQKKGEQHGGGDPWN